MDLNISGLTYFPILKRRALALFSLTKRLLTLPIKIFINFDSQLFYTFCGI